MGIEATWEWRLLIFIKSSSSVDRISAWVYTHCQPGMCTRMLPCNYGLGMGVCECVCVHVGMCVCVMLGVFGWCSPPVLSSTRRPCLREEQAIGCLLISIRRAGSLLSGCGDVSVFIFSKSRLRWNHREEYVSWPLRMCIMLAIYFPPPFPPSGHNGFCVSLLKSSRIWTFSWHLLLRKRRQKMAGLLRAASTPWWRVSVIRRGLENNNVNKGTKQVGFNEMLPSRQYIPLCSSTTVLGSSMLRKPVKS